MTLPAGADYRMPRRRDKLKAMNLQWFMALSIFPETA